MPDLAPTPDAARRSPFWILLALAPIVWVWAVKVVVEPRPFWVHYYDPEAIYFFEGLDLTRLRAPASFDRPGAQVQLLSALLVLARGSTALDFDGFRGSAYLLTLLLLVGGCVLLFRTALRDLPGPAAVAGVWVFYAAPQSLEYLAVWSPEALFLPLGALVLAVLVRAARPGFGTRDLVAAGLGVGSLCALKLTFLPWALGLVLATLWFGGDDLGTRLRRSGAALAAVAAAFILWTIPMLSRARELVAWVWRILSRSGEYGSGDAGPPTLASVAENVSEVIFAAKGWYLLLGLLLAVPLGSWARRRAVEAVSRGELWLYAFAASSFLAGLALAIRQPVARYFLPAGLLAIVLLRLSLQSRAIRLNSKAAGFAALAMVALLAGKQALLDLRIHERRIEGESQLRGELEAALSSAIPRGENRLNGPVIWGFRAPVPSLALHVMARSPEDHREVFAAYPDEGYVDWSGVIRKPERETPWSWLALQKPEERVVAGLCEGGREVGRFVLFRRQDCASELESIPSYDARERSSRPRQGAG